MNGGDRILEAFLREQQRQGQELAEGSDLLKLRPMVETPDQVPSLYVAQFLCKGLVRERGGEIVEASEFVVGISFPPDYLRRVDDPMRVLTLLDPPGVWHPNIRCPAICVGRIPPGTGLVDLVYQCFEILTYTNWASHDALNIEAAQWARNHEDRFPVDRRPLKRRKVQLEVREVTTS